MRVAVIGAGYVGLVSSACLVELGHQVVCVDCDAGKVDRLSNGDLPIYEPGLPGLYFDGLHSGKLAFTERLPEAVKDAEIAIIAVGTPPRPDDGEADLTHVYTAASQVILAAQGPLLIVIKSTVPVGTGDLIERVARKKRPGLELSVVSNPEFLRAGTAVEDFMRPDRIVVGATGAAAFATMRALYAKLVDDRVLFMQTSRRTAELIKYTTNAFLALKVCFLNEIADLCEQVRGDVTEVARGIGYDRRIGSDFLRAGPGYGGACFPGDSLTLLRTAQDLGVSLKLVEQTVAVNETRKGRMVRKVVDALGGDVCGKTIAILGLACKAGTDDVRESPALPLIASLQQAGARIRAFDPEAMPNAWRVLQGVAFCSDVFACVYQAHALVLVTDWPELRAIDLYAAGQLMESKILIDLRNAFDAAEVAAFGFDYVPVGRQASLAPRLTEIVGPVEEAAVTQPAPPRLTVAQGDRL